MDFTRRPRWTSPTSAARRARRNGSRSTSCTAALAAVGSEAAQSKRAVELPPGSRHAHCGRAASRRLQGLAVRLESWRSRARIIARGRLATILDEEGHWRGFYGLRKGPGRGEGLFKGRDQGRRRRDCARCSEIWRDFDPPKSARRPRGGPVGHISCGGRGLNRSSSASGRSGLKRASGRRRSL